MRQRGTWLTSLAELDDLRSLTPDAGPYLTLYLSLRPATEELALATQLQWQGARERAAEAGAPSQVLAAVDSWVEGAHREGAGLCVVAASDGPAHVEHLVRPPPCQFVRWEAIPTLSPLLAVRQVQQPHVVALVDREGADVTVGHHGSAATATSERSVEGRTHPERKVKPGGWSQRRIQQRAEETWQRNMRAVAEEVAGLARDTGARIVALGGDQRAVGLVRDQLPEEIAGLVEPIAVTRSADGSATHLEEELAAVLDRWADQHIARTVESYHEELGQQDRATAGPTDTLAALRAARVALLLVALRCDDPDRAWLGDSADQVFVSADAAGEVSPGGTAGPSAPLFDAAVGAALATGAEVLVLPGDAPVPGGMGALLRW